MLNLIGLWLGLTVIHLLASSVAAGMLDLPVTESFQLGRSISQVPPALVVASVGVLSALIGMGRLVMKRMALALIVVGTLQTGWTLFDANAALDRWVPGSLLAEAMHRGGAGLVLGHFLMPLAACALTRWQAAKSERD